MSGRADIREVRFGDWIGGADEEGCLEVDDAGWVWQIFVYEMLKCYRDIMESKVERHYQQLWSLEGVYI